MAVTKKTAAKKAPESLEEKLEALKTVMPFRWKVQAAIGKDKTKCLCVSYIDSRQVQDHLDAVMGVANWQDKYHRIGNELYCSIGVRVGNTGEDDWIWKTDCGTKSQTEGEKGEASDAFKRAAVKWGVGRFLYRIPAVFLNAKPSGKSCIPLTMEGKPLRDVTAFINGMQNKPSPGDEPMPPALNFGSDDDDGPQETPSEQSAQETPSKETPAPNSEVLFPNQVAMLERMVEKKGVDAGDFNTYLTEVIGVSELTAVPKKRFNEVFKHVKELAA